jgi:hypothetical protein
MSGHRASADDASAPFNTNSSEPLPTAEILRLAGKIVPLLEKKKMMYLRLELKVCEGCGALWLRSEQRTSVYCTTCSTRLSEFPVRRKHAGGRPRTRGLATNRPALRLCVGGGR